MQNEKVLVSVILTTYKRSADMVLRALKSVYTQTYSNIEVIVVDDSPIEYENRTDVEKKVRETYSQVKYLKHEKNMGACAARNTGLNHANGEYIAFIDDDDEWVDDKLKKQVIKARETNADLIYCRYYKVNDTSGKCTRSNNLLINGDVYNILITENFIGSTSLPLISRKALISIGGFDTKMQSAQDYDVWLRLSLNNKVDYVDDYLVVYHVHEGEQISTNAEKKINGLERLNFKNREYLSNNADAYWIRYMKLIPFYSSNGDRVKALNTWWNCAKKRKAKIMGNCYYFSWAIGIRKNIK